MDGRHIDVITSSEAGGKEESNQLEVPLAISNESVLLERSKTKSDDNTGVNNQHLNHQMKFSWQVWKADQFLVEQTVTHRGDAVSRGKKKLTEKIRGLQLDELEKSRSNLHRKMTKETNTVEYMLYFFKNTEVVREQLQQSDDIFRMMLDIQKSYNSLLPPAEQKREEEWFEVLDHNICSFKWKIHSWIKDAEADRHAQLSSKWSVSTRDFCQTRLSGGSSSKASNISLRKKRGLGQEIKMAELMAEAEYMEISNHWNLKI